MGKEKKVDSDESESSNKVEVLFLLAEVVSVLREVQKDFFEIKKQRIEIDREELKAQNQLENKDLEVLKVLDFREKIYRGVLIFICITALVFVAMYVDKSEAVIPVITLIVGLLLKGNPITDFASFKRHKHSESSSNLDE